MAERSAQGNRSLPRATQVKDRLRFSLRNRAVICRFGRQGPRLRVAQYGIPGARQRVDRSLDRLHARFPALRSTLRRTGAQSRLAAEGTVAVLLPRIPI